MSTALDFGAALAAVHTADFVGVLELLPEALCLFEYRATGALPASNVCRPTARTKMGCGCRAVATSATAPDAQPARKSSTDSAIG